MLYRSYHGVKNKGKEAQIICTHQEDVFKHPLLVRNNRLSAGFAVRHPLVPIQDVQAVALVLI